MVVALAIAVAVTAMLVLLSVSPAVGHRADRVAWTEQALPEVEPGDPGSVTVSSQGSYIGARSVQVVSVGAPGANPPLPPGVSALPGPGQVLLSPALKELLEETPGAHERYGTVVGTIGDEGLRGPDDLVALRGVDAARSALDGSAITSFSTVGQGHEASGIERMALLLGAASLAVMVAVLVGAALRMTATRRRRRMAALGLLGATDRQVAHIAEGEMTAPALIGASVGVGGFILVRPTVATYGYEGAQFFAEDLWPGTVAIISVVTIVLLACVVATRISMRHTTRDALEVTRQGTEFRTRPLRWLPLSGTVVVAALTMWLTAPAIPNYLVVVVFLMLMAGILVAGPEMTHLVGRLLARSPRPSAVLAGNRLQAHPADAFRPAAGVALALLISTTFVALVPAAAQSLITEDQVGQQVGSAQATLPYTSSHDTETLIQELSSLHDISDPVAIHKGTISTSSGPLTAWVGTCESIRKAAQLSSLTCANAPVLATSQASIALRDQPSGEVYNLAPREVLAFTAVPEGDEITSAQFPLDSIAPMTGSGAIDLPDVIIDPAELAPTIETFRPTLILFTCTSDATVEKARQLIEDSQASATVATRATTFDGYSEDVRRLYETITAGTTTLAIIAALGLALATISTLLERRRFDTTLRTIGIPNSTLRQAALLEALTPLLVASTAATVLGSAFGAAVITTTSDTTYPAAGALRPLGVTVLASATIVIVVTLLAEARTRHSVVRWE